MFCSVLLRDCATTKKLDTSPTKLQLTKLISISSRDRSMTSQLVSLASSWISRALVALDLAAQLATKRVSGFLYDLKPVSRIGTPRFISFGFARVKPARKSSCVLSVPI